MSDSQLGFDKVFINNGNKTFTEKAKELFGYKSLFSIGFDILFLNDGNAEFRDESFRLPDMRTANATVKVADLDQDGVDDIFVVGRIIPRRYPLPADSDVLLNREGKFVDVIDELCQDFRQLGMISDAAIVDVDQDGLEDKIFVGERLSITVFSNNGSGFERIVPEELDKSNGWWNCIKAADLDNDGDFDFVLGNWGLNSIFKASKEEPLSMIAKDFNQDGTVDPILMLSLNGKDAPYADWMQFCKKMPTYFNRFLTPKSYAETLSDILFSVEEMKGALSLKAYQMSSVVLVKEGGFRFRIVELPNAAQVAPINAIAFQDVNKDSILDLVLAGNTYSNHYEQAPMNALKGLVLINHGNSEFEPVGSEVSGISSSNEIRSVASINTADLGNLLLFGSNNDSLLVYKRVDSVSPAPID